MSTRTAIHQFDDGTKDLAYQLWVFTCSRNLPRVAEILKTEHKIAVPDRTLRDWVERYRWHERGRKDLANIAPDIDYQIATNVTLAALDASIYLRDVHAGTKDPDKAKLQSSWTAIHTYGYSPASAPGAIRSHLSPDAVVPTQENRGDPMVLLAQLPADQRARAMQRVRQALTDALADVGDGEGE